MAQIEQIPYPYPSPKPQQKKTLYVPDRYTTFVIPPGVSEETGYILEQLFKKEKHRDQELIDLATIFDGGDGALDNRFFPKMEQFDFAEWADVKNRLMVLVNLLKVAVKRLRSAVYGGYISRTPSKDHPYRKELMALMSRRYPNMMRCWYESKILFGFAVAAGLLKRKNNRPYQRLWLPFTPDTHCIQDKSDAWEYCGIGEFGNINSDTKTGNKLKFITRDACGVIVKGREPVIIDKNDDSSKFESYIQVSDFGFLPAVVGQGDERRHWGRASGLSLVRDVIKATIRGTDTLLKATSLMKLQTNAILWYTTTTQAMTAAELGAALKEGILPLKEDGKVGYATPSSNISDVIALLDRIIEIVSIQTGIPIEDLNASFSGDFSAEASKRRAMPLTSLAEEQVEISIDDEEDLALILGALYEWSEGEAPVDLEEMREREEFHTEIDMEPTVIGTTDSEVVSNAIQLNSIGAWSDEKLARRFNKRATEREILARTAEIRRRREANIAHKSSQDAMGQTEKLQPKEGIA